MASLNKIIVIGNVGSDPEMRFTPSGNPVTDFSLATNRKYSMDGEKKEDTQWFRITAWNKLAETCNQYLQKGKQVYVEGRVQLNTWEKPDGTTASRMEIIANSVIFLGQKTDEARENLNEPEDIPFD